MGYKTTILGISPYNIFDFPRKIARTVFLAGCNFRCPFCFVPQYVLGEKILFKKEIPKDEFFQFLEKEKNFLTGVILCGGEPLVADDLADFCYEIKKRNLAIKLNTNGSFSQKLKFLIEEKLLDYVALDIKAPKEKYNLAIGLINPFVVEKIVGEIENSLVILKKSKIDFEVRTTFVPGLLNEKDVLSIARWVCHFCSKYILQNFKPQNTLDPDFKKIKSFPFEYLHILKEKLNAFFPSCLVR